MGLLRYSNGKRQRTDAAKREPRHCPGTLRKTLQRIGYGIIETLIITGLSGVAISACTRDKEAICELSQSVNRNLHSSDNVTKSNAARALTSYYLCEGDWESIIDLLHISDRTILIAVTDQLREAAENKIDLSKLEDTLHGILIKRTLGAYSTSSESYYGSDLYNDLYNLGNNVHSALAHHYVNKKDWNGIRILLSDSWRGHRSFTIHALERALRGGQDISGAAKPITESLSMHVYDQWEITVFRLLHNMVEKGQDLSGAAPILRKLATSKPPEILSPGPLVQEARDLLHLIDGSQKSE